MTKGVHCQTSATMMEKSAQPGIGHPGRAAHLAERHELDEVVERAELVVVDHDPHHARHHRRDHDRDQEQRREHAAAALQAVQQQGQADARAPAPVRRRRR